MPYFPMFLDIRGRRCLVVGGGAVALRKVEALRDFGARITVLAPDILPELAAMADVVCIRRHFAKQDVKGFALVVAATDDPEQNHQVSNACQRENIPVNAVDQMQDCSFIFPAYIKEGEVVAAFSSGGQSPLLAQYLKEQIRPVLTPELGELASFLGGIRKMVQEYTKTECVRKEIFRELLAIGLKKGLPSVQEELEGILSRYRQ